MDRHQRSASTQILLPNIPIRSVLQPSGVRSPFKGLKELLVAVLAQQGTPAQVNSLVHFCHVNAEGALFRKGHLSHLVRLHGLSLRDLAFDTISDLFARDDEGRFTVLESYFSAYDVAGFSDDETYFFLQRLVLARVRNGLFRLYGEVDPQLARVLRNVKIASRSLGMFNEVDWLGDTCLTPALVETNQHLPSVDTEILTAWLAEETSGNEFIPELLGKLCLLLKRQTTHSRVVSMVSIGIAIRALYDQKRIPRFADSVTHIDAGAMDAAKAIRESCDALRATTLPKYVHTHKVSPEEFNAYFTVIEEMLNMRFLHQDGAGFELSESFLRLVPGVTLQEYRQTHRSRLEYLARLAQERVAEYLLT